MSLHPPIRRSQLDVFVTCKGCRDGEGGLNYQGPVIGTKMTYLGKICLEWMEIIWEGVLENIIFHISMKIDVFYAGFHIETV